MKLTKQPILPGFESGAYERRPSYNPAELDAASLRQDAARRGNHVSVRLSTEDLDKLHKLALAEGMPVQSLIASIVHKHVQALATQDNDPQAGHYFEGDRPTLHEPVQEPDQDRRSTGVGSGKSAS